MAIFEYQAIAKTGKAVKGIIDADSPAAARRKLRDQDLHPTAVAEARDVGRKTGSGKGGNIGRVSTRDIALFTRQLATLLHAGMPLVEALTALLDQTSKARLCKAIYDVRDRVSAGSSLASALAEQPKVFSELYVNMVGAGEMGGALETVLFRLADVLEHTAKLRARLLSTLAYPIFMLMFALGIITFLMTVIVPRITAIFEKQGQKLPAITTALIDVSHFIGSYWMFMVAAVVIAPLTWRLWVARPQGRIAWDRFKLKVPGVGHLYLKIVTARFARTLGTMLESGLTMLSAIDVVRSVIGNKYLDGIMEEVRSGVRRGRDLAVPLKEAGIFPPMMLHMVDLGQRSGEIEQMLIRVADTYDEDVRLTMDALVGLLEPIIIIVMGIFVALLVMAILLPILRMSSNIK